MVLMITTFEVVTTLEIVLMITTHKVKQLLKLAQAVKDAQGDPSFGIKLKLAQIKN